MTTNTQRPLAGGVSEGAGLQFGDVFGIAGFVATCDKTMPGARWRSFNAAETHHKIGFQRGRAKMIQWWWLLVEAAVLGGYSVAMRGWSRNEALTYALTAPGARPATTRQTAGILSIKTRPRRDGSTNETSQTLAQTGRTGRAASRGSPGSAPPDALKS
jgi:hypothetical protein